MAAGSNMSVMGVRAGGYDISGEVLAGIQKASSQTGIDFGYLMAQAAKESGFNPRAKAGTSSAAGLYQFVEQTWLSVVRKHGAEHGLGDLAAKIKFADGGGLRVSDSTTRRQILDLRRDPEIAAVMAAEHAADNKAILEAKLKRKMAPTDLYLAHFLGVSGAQKFLRALDSSPGNSAAPLFSRAAEANPSIFYHKDGRARSLREVYDRFDQRMDADIALFDDFEADGPGVLEGPTAAKAPIMAASGGAGGMGGHIHPVSVLSPVTLVALASLPVTRESNKEDTGQRRSLFERNALVEPLA
jgi:hypothetical protein